MGTTRRAVLKGTAALAGLAAVQASGLAGAASAAAAGAGGGHPKANVLLVHGAWVDGSSWSRVVAILQRRGHNVVAVPLPLTSLAEDVAWTRHVLAERLAGPTVLAGHAYGGAVISGAATGVENVSAWCWPRRSRPTRVSAWVNWGAGFLRRLAWPTPSPTRWLSMVRPGGDPDLLRPGPRGAGGAGAGRDAKPIAARSFTDPAGPPGWKRLPSWFLVSTQDRMINPDLLGFMAARIGARTVEFAPAMPRRPPIPIRWPG